MNVMATEKAMMSLPLSQTFPVFVLHVLFYFLFLFKLSRSILPHRRVSKGGKIVELNINVKKNKLSLI